MVRAAQPTLSRLALGRRGGLGPNVSPHPAGLGAARQRDPEYERTVLRRLHLLTAALSGGTICIKMNVKQGGMAHRRSGR